MAPKKSSQPIEMSPDMSDDASQSQEEASQSQPLDIVTLTALSKKQKEQSKARRAQREKDIERTRKQRLDKVQKKMNEARCQHEEKARELRRPVIEQLRELLQQKRHVEARIDECHAAMDKAWASTLQQLQVAVTDRIAELSVLINNSNTEDAA